VVSTSDLASIQSNTNSVYFKNGQKNLGNSRLDREGFIRLMLAQLQQQDPLGPQDNSQMLQQQLMLEQADQMKSMVDASRFSQAGNMIGKTAVLMDAPWDFVNGVSTAPEWDAATNGPKMTSGIVEGVQFDSSKGVALVRVNGRYYDASKVQYVFQDPVSSAEQIANAAALVGKNVKLPDIPWDPDTGAFTANIDPETKLPRVVTGSVENIRFDFGSNTTLVEINGKYYNAESIQQILSGTT
jgi:flagellar basal-body rod modification protein FlgD